MMKNFRILQLLLFALVLGFAGWMPGKAQDTSHAGLVVQHSDGSIVTRCVSFSETTITGYDLLNRSGLSFISSFGSMGATVCKIGNDGCSADNCFCQSPQNYWSYWYLKDGSWQYSNLGASNHDVQNGDVDGWRWGSGSSTPPLYTFEQICQQPTDTPTSTPVPPTETLIPATETLLPTETPIPTEISLPTLEHRALPSITPRPSVTAASLSTRPVDSMQQAAQSEPAVSAAPETLTSPTATSAKAAAPEEPTAEASSNEAALQGQASNDQSAGGDQIALADQASGRETAGEEEDTSAEASVPSKATAGAPPALARSASADAASSKNTLSGGLIIGMASYLTFGAILVGLLAFVVILLFLRRR